MVVENRPGGYTRTAERPAGGLGRSVGCWTCVHRSHRFYFLEFVFQPLLGVPQIVVLLQPQPQPWPVSSKLADPERHLGCDGMRTGKNAVELLTRDPKPPGRLADRQAQGWEHILAHDFARMNGGAAQRTFDVILSHAVSLMVLLKVNSAYLVIFPFERDAPRAVDVNAVALGSPVEAVEIEARYTQVRQRLGLIQSLQPAQTTRLQVVLYAATAASFKQLGKPSVLEASNHAEL